MQVPLTIHSARGGHLFTVQVAATEAQQEHGLMFYRSLGADQGMIFFPAGVTLFTPGDQTLTVSDLAGGFSASLTVTVQG